MVRKITILTLATMMLAACGSTPPRKAEVRASAAPVENRSIGGTSNDYSSGGPGGYLVGDGPGVNVPSNLDQIPDAVPKSEPLHRYANRPYVALGKSYTPITIAGNYKERGIASWYGKKFHGQRTSSGETYDMYAMTAAHPTLPIPSYARVTRTETGKSVVVRINDRGPFLHDRVMDLSYVAAHKLGIIGTGSAEVEVESLALNAITSNVTNAEPVQTRPLAQSAPPAKFVSTAGKIYLQLGAFKSREAAEIFMAKMQSELADVGKQVSIFLQAGLARVHIGPYANQDEARSSASGLQDRLGFKPMVNLH